MIRSLTGTRPVEMYSSARLLCSGVQRLREARTPFDVRDVLGAVSV